MAGDLRRFGFFKNSDATRVKRGFSKYEYTTETHSGRVVKGLAWVISASPDVRAALEHNATFLPGTHKLVDFRLLEDAVATVPGTRRAPDKSFPIEAVSPTDRVIEEINEVKDVAKKLSKKLTDFRDARVRINPASEDAGFTWQYEGENKAKMPASTFRALAIITQWSIDELYPSTSAVPEPENAPEPA